MITNTRGLLIRVISLAAHRRIRQPLAVSPRHTAVHAVSPLRVASQRELPPPRLVVPCVASFAVSSSPSPLELHRLFFARLSRRPCSTTHGQECSNSGALAAYSARQADSRRGVPLSSLRRDETRRDEARRDEQPHTQLAKRREQHCAHFVQTDWKGLTILLAPPARSLAFFVDPFNNPLSGLER